MHMYICTLVAALALSSLTGGAKPPLPHLLEDKSPVNCPTATTNTGYKMHKYALGKLYCAKIVKWRYNSNKVHNYCNNVQYIQVYHCRMKVSLTQALKHIFEVYFGTELRQLLRL